MPHFLNQILSLFMKFASTIPFKTNIIKLRFLYNCQKKQKSLICALNWGGQYF